MPITYRDLVMEFCYTTGTGPLTLAGTTNGFRTAVAAWGAGDHESHWVIRHPTNDQWEVFRGTVNGTGLTRDEVLASSNGGALVDFSPGRKEVRCTLPASVFEPVLLPTADTTEIVRDPVDGTKRMRIDVGAVATGTTRVVAVPDQDVDLTPNSGTFPAATHAARHQHGGGDEVATATPAANAIPKAGAGGTLATGWLPGALPSLSAHNTNGVLTQTAANTFTARTISGGTGVTVTNGDGVSGNPSIAIGQSVATTATPQFERIGIGAPALPQRALTTAGTLTGATTQLAYTWTGTFDSMATSSADSFFSFPTVQDASFTMADLWHFRAINASKGASATVTRQTGFYCGDLTIGGSNFAFRAVVSSGASKWNFYADGTANNLMNGPLILGSSAAPTLAADQAALHAIDAAAGNRCIGWKTENGQTGKLYTVATYTPINVTTDRSFDADSTTLAEIADVLGTLIADLKLTGLLA